MPILCQTIIFAFFPKEGANIEEYSTFYRNGKLFTRRLVRNKTHGMSHTRIYSIWKGMRRRCNNPNAPKYEYYGGVGVRVCDEWNKPYGGFEAFYEWAINNGYSDNLTIDRIDSNKNYCPENCRWTTMKENRLKALKTKKIPTFQYFAYNENEKKVVIFYKIRDFEEYSGVDERRVSDGLKPENQSKKYFGWKFSKISIKEANIIEGQETIPFGSTTEDELPLEVQIIRLGLENYDYVLKRLHIIG